MFNRNNFNTSKRCFNFIYLNFMMTEKRERKNGINNHKDKSFNLFKLKSNKTKTKNKINFID
jgi:hypothetical protein